MSIYRYVNNTAANVVGGSDTVPAYGQLLLTAASSDLAPYVNISIDLYIDGVEQNARIENAVQLLFVLRSANMAITTDQAFTKVFTGTSYVATSVVAKRKTGGASVACAGGIYDTASKAGVVLAANTTNWVSLSSTVPVILGTSDLNKVLPTTANAFLSLTTGSTAACTADVFIYGIIVD